MVLHAREQGKQVFFELKPDEFLGSHVAVRLGSLRIRIVPRIIDRLGEEIDPAPICCSERQSTSEGWGHDINRVFVELEGSGQICDFEKNGYISLTLIRTSL